MASAAVARLRLSPNAHRLFSAIVQRLAAPPIAPATETKPQAAPRLFRVDDTALRRLEERFFALHEMSDEPQARGRQQEGKMN